MRNPKSVIVIGLGNPLMGDEGIGTILLSRLEQIAARQKLTPSSNLEFIDAGTGGMNLLHHIANRQKAVLIDCALMNTPPGTIRRFTQQQVQSIKQLSHLSLHEVDILKVLEISRRLGESPDEVIFFGIEPAEICQRISLSPILQEKIPHYIQTILDEINPSF